MRALVFERNVARFAASRVASVLGSGRGASIGPLRLVDVEPPKLPGAGWTRVTPLLSGICGSDLATLDGRSSRYFEDIVSFPFVPGHEVVGITDDDPARRVVIEAVLGCAARGIVPLCRACAAGDLSACEQIGFGHIAPGLQTGYCADTGGGWSHAGLVAHESQLHDVPDALSDEDAVVVEPVACALHGALRARVDDGDVVVVVGAGMLGLCVVAAITSLAASGRCATPGALIVGARHEHQRRLSEELGATAAVASDQVARTVRRRSGSLALGPGRLTGGADVVIDCVGSAESISQALGLVRARGRIVLAGMPGRVHVDLAPLWQREVSLVGTYAYGSEHTAGDARSFDLALEIVARHRLGRLVSAAYPIERFEEALAHAGAAGRRGAVKIAFDLGRPHRGGER